MTNNSKHVMEHLRDNRERIKALQYADAKEMYMNESHDWSRIYDKPVRKYLFYTLPSKILKKWENAKECVSRKWTHIVYKINSHRSYWINPDLYEFEVNHLEKAYFEANNSHFTKTPNGDITFNANVPSKSSEDKKYNELADELKDVYVQDGSWTQEALDKFQYDKEWIDGKEVAVEFVDTSDKPKTVEE